MKLLPSITLGTAVLLLASCVSPPQDVTDPDLSPVEYLLALKIRDGKEQAFHALMREMVVATEEEPGTQVYEWFLSQDGMTCHIHERFADTAAFDAHLASFRSNYAERFMLCVEVTSVTVYGNADETARATLAEFEPVYFEAFGGFRR